LGGPIYPGEAVIVLLRSGASKANASIKEVTGKGCADAPQVPFQSYGGSAIAVGPAKPRVKACPPRFTSVTDGSPRVGGGRKLHTWRTKLAQSGRFSTHSSRPNPKAPAWASILPRDYPISWRVPVGGRFFRSTALLFIGDVPPRSTALQIRLMTRGDGAWRGWIGEKVTWGMESRLGIRGPWTLYDFPLLIAGFCFGPLPDAAARACAADWHMPAREPREPWIAQTRQREIDAEAGHASRHRPSPS
jgi:hypothetical protein